MRFLISHRGNLNGPNPKLENTEEYIAVALAAGFDVEVDIWKLDGELWLGHDSPTRRVGVDFLDNKRLWIHCKNLGAYEYLQLITFKHSPHYFMHENEDRIITSTGWDWVKPGAEINDISIAVMPELAQNWDISKGIGVCTDFIARYK